MSQILVPGLPVRSGLKRSNKALYLPVRKSGYYCMSDGMTLGSQAGTDNRCYFTPFRVLDPITVDRIGVGTVTTAGAAGSIARLGIYRDSGSYTPGELLLDAGTVATDAAVPAFLEITISQALEGDSLYWLAAANQHAASAPTYRVYTGRVWPDPHTASASILTSTGASYTLDGVTDTLPADASAAVVTNVAAIAVAVRVV